MRVAIILLLMIFSLNSFSQDRPFITTWKTDNEGGSCASCIFIPISNLIGGYDYEVDWDMDGVYDEIGLTSSVMHDFGTPGTYTIAIRGIFPGISFQSQSDAKKILSIDQWGDIQWKALVRAFLGCTNLDIEASDAPDLSAVEELNFTFMDATSLTKGLGNWDVSNVVNMSGMFSGASSFNEDLSDWDVSNVEYMFLMFGGADSMIGSLKSWNVSSVVNMSGMFNGADNFTGDISNWDVSSVETMSGMFKNAIAFNGDLSRWDISSVTNSSDMFNGATNFNGNLSDWDVSSIREMWGMFWNATTFDQDLSRWDVSSVLDMNRMFFHASSFNQDLSTWDVSSVTNMGSMFVATTLFDQDLSTWDVSSVTTMGFMFSDAASFNQDLSSWHVASVTDMEFMLDNCGMNLHNYESTLSGWAANPSTSDSLTLGSENLEYCDDTARNLLLAKGWTIEGDIQADEADCLTATKDFTLEADPYLYPMPAQEEVHIANLEVSGKYKLYGSLGKLVSEGEYQPGNAVSVNQFSQGLYYMIIETPKRIFTFSYIKT